MNLPRLVLRLLGRRLPRLDGTVVAGVEAPVTITRDRFGVPHIRAETEHDAWYALGFCQGQDRAFQLETRLRVVRGTLAALVGSDGLAIDHLSRRIGFARHGAALLEALGGGARPFYEAFAAGVQAGVAEGKGRTHEFTLLRTGPSPFQASDALGFLAVQAFALASNWDVELARLRMLALDGPEAVAALHPPYRPDHPASDRPGDSAVRVVDALAEDLAAATRLFSPGAGSNNWAISGSRTASGRPVLANDPHLAPTLPPHWYLAHLVTPEWSLTGAAVPGTPVFAVGHNGHAAWGVTAGLIDNTDLFIEDVGPDGRSVRRGDGYRPCRVRVEEIEVRGGPSERIDVLETDRGPVVGPAFEGPFGALSMAATWLRPGDLGGSVRLGSIRSFEELRQVFAEWPAIPLNIAYADVAGAIGWQLVGEAPVRGKGGGTIPQEAADEATRWKGAIKASQLPHAVDPEAGFVATANNLPSTDAYLGSDFLDGYRVKRISEVIASRNDWDLTACLRLQLDQESIPWREMRDAVLGAADGEAATLLADWDGVVSPDSPAAAVFEVFLADLCRSIAENRAPKSARFALGEGFTPLVPFSGLLVRRVSHLVTLLESRPPWFEEGWDEAIRRSLERSLETLRSKAGDDPARWAWGSVRPLRLKHPMGLRRPLDRVYDLGPFPHGGDANTLNPAPVNPSDPLANPDFAIASLRFAVEPGRWEHARFALPGGQSGNPYSPHYSDQLPLWRRGDGMTIPWDDGEVERVGRHRLSLVPAGGGEAGV